MLTWGHNQAYLRPRQYSASDGTSHQKRSLLPISSRHSTSNPQCHVKRIRASSGTFPSVSTQSQKLPRSQSPLHPESFSVNSPISREVERSGCFTNQRTLILRTSSPEMRVPATVSRGQRVTWVSNAPEKRDEFSPVTR